MRLFWVLQVCIGAAAIASSTALSGGCSSSITGGGTGTGTGTGPDTGTGSDTDTGPDTGIDTCFQDDQCAFMAQCCAVEACAHTHCEGSCFDSCGIFYGFAPECAACVQMNGCPQEKNCTP